MTSLFDVTPPRQVTEMPLPASDDQLRGVSLLEFSAMDAPEEEEIVEAIPVESAEDVAERTEEERAARMRVMIDAAREEAAAEARLFAQMEYESRLDEERARLDHALTAFATERARYFAEAEGEVVRLALAVAAKVLAREVAEETLPLSAGVYAALSRVQTATGIRLRVRPEQAPGWVTRLAERGEDRVEVQADRMLQAGDLVLETSIGRVELGVAVQLEEIGRWFRELAGRAAQPSGQDRSQNPLQDGM